MRILAVIDLLGGQVVRGVAGRRAEYRPVVSQLTGDCSPAAVARAFQQLGLREVYVADLGAIAGAEPNWQAYREIAAAGMTPWIDAGLQSAQQARRLVEFCQSNQTAAPLNVAGIIAGLESLPDFQTLCEILTLVGNERLIFSLDLRHGQPLVATAAWADLSPTTIVEQVLSMGVRRMILLDLAAVGVGAGTGTESLCREVRRASALHGKLEITVGGGIRQIDDLPPLAAAGADAVLIASAFHDGRIGPADIAQWEGLNAS